MTTVALAQLALSLLPQITVGVEKLVEFISSVRTAARQTNQWTDDMEKAWQDNVIAGGKAPAQQPDPK